LQRFEIGFFRFRKRLWLIEQELDSPRWKKLLEEVRMLEADQIKSFDN